MRRTLLAVMPLLLLGCGGSHRAATTGATVTRRVDPPVHAVAAPRRLVPTGTGQLHAILMIDPRHGAVQQVGRLPAASSDSSAAVIGRTAYIVGGYTGARWLDTIVAFTPGGHATVVAHLPHTLRYAAVTAVSGRVIVAGGSLEAGSASDAVYAYTPATHRVALVGRLPAPTTHAAAAAFGGFAY